MNRIILLVLVLEYPLIPLLAQESLKRDYHAMGMEALSRHDTSSAKTFFKRSILKYGDAASHFELANIYLVCDEPYCVHFGKEHLKSAVLKDPSNLYYRLRLAEVYTRTSRYNAMSEYEKILTLDNTYAPAWLALGRLKVREFNEYHHSANAESGFLIPLESFAMEDYLRAEHCLKQAIRLDPGNREAMFELGLLYEDAGYPARGIPYLEGFIAMDPENEQARLLLGLLFYKSLYYEKSFEAFKDALSLMNPEDKLDFIYHSAHSLLEPVIKNDPNLKTDPDALETFLTVYWQSNDPLYLTEYNERLLEHYSRVAHANLRFSVPKHGITGWKSDRGQTVLRYGEPASRVRLRPRMEMDGVRIKTEIWNYDRSGMVLAFTDEFMNGNYRFSVPPMGESRFRPQFYGDSELFFEELKNRYHQLYTPKFEGPTISLPFEIAQFAAANDKSRNKTEVYIYYGMQVDDTLKIDEIRQYAHHWGVFLMDNKFRPEFEMQASAEDFSSGQILRLSDAEKLVVNSEMLQAASREWNFAFEVIRKNDNAVATHHFRHFIKPYSTYSLSISDIVLASYLSPFEAEGTVLSRKNIHMTPNPTHRFSKNTDLYLYFEIYNLKTSENGISEYTQSLEIKRTEDNAGSLLVRSYRTLLSTIGIGKKESAITLTSSVQVKGQEIPVYFQLDMRNYPAGNYCLTITVRDVNSGDTARSATLVRWEN